MAPRYRHFSLLFLIPAFVALGLPFRTEAQGPCVPDGPPDRHGASGFTGQDGYVFDYWSDAGEKAGKFGFQLGVVNKGATPLTVDWLTADFFRRGIAAGAAVNSECREDRNPPNVAAGTIKYGPLTQNFGPNARFYKAQGAAAGAQGQSSLISVSWNAILTSGETYVVSFKAEAGINSDRQLQFSFANFEAPVEIEWPQVITPAVLLAAQRSPAPPTVRAGRLLLPRAQSVVFRINDAKTRPANGPLSVYIPNGELLYRDVFSGLTLLQ